MSTQDNLRTQLYSSFRTFRYFICLLGAICLILEPNFILSKVEASETYKSERKPMVIKGLYIGMNDKEAIKIFSGLKDTSDYRLFVEVTKVVNTGNSLLDSISNNLPHYELRTRDPGKDYHFCDVDSDGSPFFQNSHLEFKDNKLDVLFLSPRDTYNIFNLSGIELQDFADRFGGNYKIRMSRNTSGGYFYRDLENGYGVEIKNDNSFLFRSIDNPNKINFE